MTKRGLTLILISLLTFLMVACGESEEKTPEVTITQGRNVAVDDNGVVFWGWNEYLCSALLNENGEIYDFAIESQGMSEVDEVAIHDGYLYMASDEGIFKYSLEEMQGSGVVSPLQLTDDRVDGFQIREDKLYYGSGYHLYSVPLSGGEESTAASDLIYYELTNDGIYYAGKNGNIYLMSYENSAIEMLTETEEGCLFDVTDDYIYYRCAENDQIIKYTKKDKSTEIVNKRQGLSDYSYVWATENSLLYENKDYERCLFSLEDETELLVENSRWYPAYYEGVLSGEILYGCNHYSDILYFYDLKNQIYKEYDMAEYLMPILLQSTAETSNSQSEYDIAEDMLGDYSKEASDFNQLSGKYLTILIPNSISWTWTKVDQNTIDIYYVPAQQSGYEGWVTTIKAYEKDDNSYTEFPAWSVAGESADKTYVALFPTDVQYDTTSSVQQKEYTSLLTHFQMMDINNHPDNNPLIVNE